MNLKLSDREFKKLLKKYEPQKIIYMYCNWKINLKSAQIDELIRIKDMKGKRNYEEDKKPKTKRNRNASTTNNS